MSLVWKDDSDHDNIVCYVFAISDATNPGLAAIDIADAICAAIVGAKGGGLDVGGEWSGLVLDVDAMEDRVYAYFWKSAGDSDGELPGLEWTQGLAYSLLLFDNLDEISVASISGDVCGVGEFDPPEGEDGFDSRENILLAACLMALNVSVSRSAMAANGISNAIIVSCGDRVHRLLLAS